VGAEVSMLHLAQRKNSEGDPRIELIGAFATQTGTAAHFDLARYRDEIKGEAWSFEFGAGYMVPTQVTLYAGAGVVAGYRRRGGEFFGAYYPEVGIIVPVSQGIGITATTKRYIQLFKEVENVIMFGIVLTER
jgi:hypothetical protein